MKQSRSFQHRIIITCEHASNHIPEMYAPLFRGMGSILKSHRGFDSGALEVAQFLAKKLKAPLFSAESSRLLVDLNRSLHHRDLFGEKVKQKPPDFRRELLEENYHPFRNATRMQISQEIEKGHPVIHLSIHSFTPVWKGEARKVDFGILYDPGRKSERNMAHSIVQSLNSYVSLQNLRIRKNAPYRGVSDGHCTALRQIFSENLYAGFELEFNQALFAKKTKEREELLIQIVLFFEVCDNFFK